MDVALPQRAGQRPLPPARGRRAAGPGLCGGLLRREAVLPESVAVRGARLVPEGFAAMLDLGVCRWDHIVLGISARSHVDALERMDAAWPEGEEHMAKLSVNAMIGLWARSTVVVYSVRSSSSELDGAGADFSQAFAYEGGMVWDFVYARRLLSNGSYRPIHDAQVAKARRILDAPPRYLAQVKTDCLLTQRLPKRFTERLRALEALRHPDGTPVYRVEETRPLLGSSRAPRMEAERPKQRRWNGVDDLISHCLAGNSLLLTGLPGTGKTHLARTIVVRLREQGEAPGVQDALLRAEPGPGGADGRPLGAQVRARKSWTGWWWRRSRSWTWRSGRTWPAWG